MIIAATFENADLRNASSDCDTTKIQLFCPNLLHNNTNALGHITNTTYDCSGAKYLPALSHPDFDIISILASGLYHAIRYGYCCLPFPSKPFTFFKLLAYHEHFRAILTDEKYKKLCLLINKYLINHQIVTYQLMPIKH